MPILTNKRNGKRAIATACKGLGKNWRLLVSGEGSQSSNHAWRLAYWLQYSKKLNLYGLRLDDHGDPTGGGIDPDDFPLVEIVAVWTDPPQRDESAIAKELLARYERVDGRVLDSIDEVGEFDLEE